MRVSDVRTPALVVDAAAFDHNISTMAAALPGERLRPHVKAHKCTALARRQLAAGHSGFTCATVREVEGMAAAGLAGDLLLANETLDTQRLGDLVNAGNRVTLAVDSEATIAAAAGGGVTEVVIDVNVGLPRCGCAPESAGALADRARAAGLRVRGVMGYEGHVNMISDREARKTATATSMELLVQAHELVGGELISAGSTATYELNTWASEIQAGSYALMDADYGKLQLPFKQALTVLATVISVSRKWAVADCGLKALGMDHGNPVIEGAKVWFCADEHIVFAPPEPVKVGDRIRVIPGHIDPTVAYHEAMWIVDGDDAVERWDVDLRGW